ncbi:hypothetical protein BDA96_02G289300 [Sorghum bicolor]|uniref:Transmembrane protein n=1 Tax=Sorghum bicolor TaxID=4558 RepID=A0A921RRQ4_SORBI|nr:hypothetical protein BDA96_02G289300 [Sorghum bicolor]
MARSTKGFFILHLPSFHLLFILSFHLSTSLPHNITQQPVTFDGNESCVIFHQVKVTLNFIEN